MSVNSYIARQFGKPTGFGGKIVTTIMNKQNRPLYEGTERLLSLCDDDKVLDIGCGNGNMVFKNEGASKIPFGDATFGKAYSINTVYFWNDLKYAMIEIKRVLKPGGIFINTLYTNETLDRFAHTRFGYKRFTPEQLTNAAQDAGFEVEVKLIMNVMAYCAVCRARVDRHEAG